MKINLKTYARRERGSAQLLTLAYLAFAGAQKHVDHSQLQRQQKLCSGERQCTHISWSAAQGHGDIEACSLDLACASTVLQT
jgi:hypothetical protein